MATRTAPFTRDRFTWLAYFMLGYFAYTQAALGPAMPFLRAELNLNYTIAAFHFSALAIGMILAGLVSASAAKRWGRPLIFWSGGGGMAVGSILLVVGRSAIVTIAGTFVMGLFGTFLLTMIPATLSDRHGDRRATALTESNTVAAGATALPPIFIGVFAGTVFGWRMVFWIAVLVWSVAAVWQYRLALPTPADSGDDDSGGKPARLSRAFWLFWPVLVLVVAVEWSVVAWSADFMEGSVGLERALASGLMTAYFVAMVTGRFAGSRLTRTREAMTLLPVALALAFGGFLVFWLVRLPVLNVIGLFLAGLGIANLFPLSLSVAQTLGASLPDLASSRVSLAAGLAILAAPQALGTVADAVGIGLAMGLVPVLIVSTALMVFVVRRRT
jgi:predicted MFS family arabinose efflux permease